VKKFLLLLAPFLLFAACKTPPPEKIAAEKRPVSNLEFDRIEAKGIHELVLFYRFKTENPRNNSFNMSILNQTFKINGKEIESKNAILKINEIEIPGKLSEVSGDMEHTITSGNSFEVSPQLHLNLNEFVQESEDDIFTTELVLELLYQYGAADSIIVQVSAETEFPRIREPVFTITSIAIMQAELINTRFTVSLRVDNPNPFPVSLSSFKYELYGHGLFWADGSEKNVLAIPAKASAETRLFLVMNFINMRRSLLDEIIAMRQVSYRFLGKAEVGTAIYWLPDFSMAFDRTGLSVVVR